MAATAYIQGHLQNVFDALYEMGVIDPVLKMDWAAHLEQMSHQQFQVRRALEKVNDVSANPEQLKKVLSEIEPQVLELLAIEVAREFADFHNRAAVH